MHPLLAHGLAESHDHDYNALSGCDISTAHFQFLRLLYQVLLMH